MEYNKDAVRMGATFNEEEFTCPYCGHVHTDSWEWNTNEGGTEGDGEFTCHDCEREFLCSRTVVVTYSTRKP